MAQSCQHCGAVTDNDSRVMCPNCGRRMAPAGAAAPPPPAAAPPPSPYAPPTAAAAQPPSYVGGDAAYAPYGTAESAWPTQAAPPAIDVDFRRDAIARTSRVTVLFRLLLAIPHLIVLVVVSVAAYIVIVVVWFAALFTARVPQGLYDFIGWVVAYGARVSSYLWLLTDRWPSFGSEPEDPVVVRLPGPQRLNRLAVLFRLILLIPAMIVAGVLVNGLAVISFFVWVVTLVLGRVPRAAFDAAASVVRYQTRYYGYGAMLTARYPGEVFGDGHDDADAGAGADEGAAGPPRVNQGARRLLILIIVVGILVSIANISARYNSHGPSSNATTTPVVVPSR